MCIRDRFLSLSFNRCGFKAKLVLWILCIINLPLLARQDRKAGEERHHRGIKSNIPSLPDLKWSPHKSSSDDLNNSLNVPASSSFTAWGRRGWLPVPPVSCNTAASGGDGAFRISNSAVPQSNSTWVKAFRSLCHALLTHSYEEHSGSHSLSYSVWN